MKTRFILKTVKMVGKMNPQRGSHLNILGALLTPTRKQKKRVLVVRDDRVFRDIYIAGNERKTAQFFSQAGVKVLGYLGEDGEFWARGILWEMEGKIGKKRFEKIAVLTDFSGFCDAGIEWGAMLNFVLKTYENAFIYRDNIIIKKGRFTSLNFDKKGDYLHTDFRQITVDYHPAMRGINKYNRTKKGVRFGIGNPRGFADCEGSLWKDCYILPR